MDKKLAVLMMVFFLSFGLFMVVTVFNQPLSFLTRAKEESTPSSKTSLIFGWPLTASADNKQEVTINVFVRNSTNVPLQNKKVTLSTSIGSIKANNITSDAAGRATFSLVSGSPGIAEVTALVDNQVQLQQKVSIKFE